MPQSSSRLESFWSPRPGPLGYVVALLAVATGIVNTHVLKTPAPVSTYVLVVIASTWFGGTRAGMVAAAGSLLALGAVMQTAQLQRLVYFILIAAFIVWIIASERRAAAGLRLARDDLQRQNEALTVEKIEAKALEELLRRNESELRLVIDSIPTMAWSLLPDGRLEFLNQRWLDYTGLTLDEALPNGVVSMHPDDVTASLEQWRHAFANGLDFEGEMRLRRRDGQYRWFLVRTTPLLDGDGKILRWYGTSMDIEDRKRAEQALRESAGQLQQLSRRLLEVQEQERRHLSRELHDEFGQLLASVKLHLHAAKGTAGAAAQASLDESATLLQRAGEELRNLALELRPAMLETAGLDATLRWLARQHEQRTGIATEVVGRVDDVSGDLAIACFRVAQEALTNVVKHTKAQHAWIELAGTEGRLELAVRDDGAGFDVATTLEQAAARGKLGLVGMRERVQILGGELRIDSGRGGGTRIHVWLPRA